MTEEDFKKLKLLIKKYKINHISFGHENFGNAKTYTVYSGDFPWKEMIFGAMIYSHIFIGPNLIKISFDPLYTIIINWTDYIEFSKLEKYLKMKAFW